MRILLLSQFFDPEPHLKGIAMARALRDRGHDVQVLTGFPNYPGGKIYKGHELRFCHDEVQDGIRIRRSWLYPSHDRSALRRIFNYLSFACTAALNVLILPRVDVVYVYTPPMTSALPAFLLRLLRRTPYVVDVQDLWPDALTAHGMIREGVITRLVGLWTHVAFRTAAHITVLSTGYRERIEQRGIKTPITVVPNWAPREIVELAPAAAQQARPDRFEVLFAGTMGKAQALETVIEAARLLANTAPHVVFRFVGGGIEVDALKGMASDGPACRVEFGAPRPVGEMGPVFAQADCLLVHLLDDPLYAITIPSKVQAYLAVGKPVLIGVRGDAAAMVDKACAGLAFTPGDPEALAAAVLRLARRSPEERARMGASGRAFYEANLAFDRGIDAIEQVLSSVAQTR